ncbi:hypothetical protein [Thermanaerothrix sp.]
MVEKVIVRGCYPLHPLTTAILSTHTFEAGAGENPRTALHFVRDRWSKGIRDQPAEREDGTPNFIFAIELVDFFEEQISKKWYEAYRTALENPPIDLTENHKAVLKALLLQRAVSELRVSELSSQVRRGSDQIELLSDLSGLGSAQVSSLLRELAEGRVIQKNGNFYSFFPVGARSPEADRIIEEAVQKTPVDRSLLEKIAKAIPSFTISQTFGHPDDWAPQQVVLTKDFFNIETLRELTSQYRIGPNDTIEESPRGVIVWLLASSEEEKLWLRQNAQALLDSVLDTKPHPLPILIVLPNKVNPGLLNAARRKIALDSLDLNQREKIGSIILKDEQSRADTEIKMGLFELLGDSEHYPDLSRQIHEYALPRAYLTSVQTLNRYSIKEVLRECYRQAYPYRVEFSDKPVFSKGVNHLRTAVENISRGLFGDTVGSGIQNLKNKDMQYVVVQEYLIKKWGLLDPENFRVKEPTSRALREAWNRLENAFPPDGRETLAKGVLVELLNPPYGHDYNTLTLLLAAWIGFHRYEIQLSLGGRVKTLGEFKEIFNNAKGPKGFLDTLITQGFAVRRINLDEQFEEIDRIIDRIKKKDPPFSIDEAHRILSKFKQIKSHPKLPQNKAELIESYCRLLEQHLDIAQKYDQQIEDWLSRLQSADFEKLIGLEKFLHQVQVPDLVVPSKPHLDILRKEWEKSLEEQLENLCNRYSQLNDLSHYTEHKNQLQKALRELKRFPILAHKVQSALDQLDQRFLELRQAEDEKPIVAEINSMDESARLASLYQYRTRLNELSNLSQRTENLRKSKLEKIETRIQQFEQLVERLPEAVETAKSLSELKKQKDLLLKNMDQTQDTPLYHRFLEIQTSIERLEGFFDELRVLDYMPSRTPSDLDSKDQRIAEIEKKYSNILSKSQREILGEERRKIDATRQQEEQKARQWLIDLNSRYSSDAQPNELLDIALKPPEFLPIEDREKLNQLIQALQLKVEKDIIRKIEVLFLKLDDEARRNCLKRLQELMGKF